MIFILIAQNWKPSKCLSTGDWMNKLRYVHKMKCYLSMRRREQLLKYNNPWIDYKEKDTKECVLYDSIDMRSKDKANYSDRNQKCFPFQGDQLERGLGKF